MSIFYSAGGLGAMPTDNRRGSLPGIFGVGDWAGLGAIAGEGREVDFDRHPFSRSRERGRLTAAANKRRARAPPGGPDWL